MAFIEAVIKIPEEAYKTCLKLKGELDEDNSILGICLINSVANGTLLPKGHGRLIDVDAVLEEPIGNTYKDIEIAETIIEADKGD